MKFSCFSPLPNALAPAGSPPLLQGAGLCEEQSKECTLARLLETVAIAQLLVLNSPAVIFVTKSYRLTINVLRKLSLICNSLILRVLCFCLGVVFKALNAP